MTNSPDRAMDALPRVSVILPTFNRVDYLRHAVQSVFAQSYAQWELIIADDGSAEATSNYLRSLEDNARVRLVWLTHTGNPAAVRNAALRVATGTYVAFLDSDDLWTPDKLQKQIESLHRHPACRWGYTGYEYIDHSGQPCHPTGLQAWTENRGPVLRAVVTLTLVCPLPSVIVERELLQRLGGFDERRNFYEDYDLWLRLALQSEADVVPEPLLQVRRHNEHYSTSDSIASMEHRGELFKAMEQALADTSLKRLVQQQRAQNALRLARLYWRSSGRSAHAFSIFWRSWGYSWRHVTWWLETARAAATLARRSLRQIGR
jgi:glycosyltransferase involved in cell wall biosynthesis